MTPVTLHTQRLKLRQWTSADRRHFAALNSDPEVMAFFPSVLSREQSDGFFDKCATHIAEHGWGCWAVELVEQRTFLGYVGLAPTNPALEFSPNVEVAWRLARPHWGLGYATEAARASLDFAFARLQRDEVLSFTALINVRSRGVMERLGMHDCHRDFDHPRVPEGSRLRRHCLYRISDDVWGQP